MNKPTPSYQRHRFPSEIISHAVWLYHRFCLSFREVEELLAERGITPSPMKPFVNGVRSLGLHTHASSRNDKAA